MSHNYRIYSLDPYKILDLVGDLGGLLEIGLAVGLLMTFSFVKDSYERSIMGDTYQVQKYNENTKDFYHSDRVKQFIMTTGGRVRRQCTQIITNKNKIVDHDSNESVKPKLTSTEDSQDEEIKRQVKKKRNPARTLRSLKSSSDAISEIGENNLNMNFPVPNQ